MRELADFAIRHYWPQWQEEADKYQLWFNDVVTRTATLIADWQAVGFAHGVMNTDNMSILGLTMDYGPFGFLDDYVPDYICNHSDNQGDTASIINRLPRCGTCNVWRKLCRRLSRSRR